MNGIYMSQIRSSNDDRNSSESAYCIRGVFNSLNWRRSQNFNAHIKLSQSIVTSTLSACTYRRSLARFCAHTHTLTTRSRQRINTVTHRSLSVHALHTWINQQSIHSHDHASKWEKSPRRRRRRPQTSFGLRMVFFVSEISHNNTTDTPHPRITQPTKTTIFLLLNLELKAKNYVFFFLIYFVGNNKRTQQEVTTWSLYYFFVHLLSRVRRTIFFCPRLLGSIFIRRYGQFNRRPKIIIIENIQR